MYLSILEVGIKDLSTCCMVWYGMVWYGMVWYGMVWYGMVWCAVLCCAVYSSFPLNNRKRLVMNIIKLCNYQTHNSVSNS